MKPTKAPTPKPPKPARASKAKPAPAEALAASLNMVTGPKGRVLPVRMLPEHYTRLEVLALRSGVTVERWLDSVLASGLATDESHWREVDDRARMTAEVDREVFAQLSRNHLSGLPPTVIDRLVEQLVLARERGRTEGYAMRALNLRGIAGAEGLLDAVSVAHFEAERLGQQRREQLTEIAGKGQDAMRLLGAAATALKDATDAAGGRS